LVTCTETAGCVRVVDTGSDEEKSTDDKQYPLAVITELTGQLTSVFVHVVPESVHDGSGHVFSVPVQFVPERVNPVSHTNGAVNANVREVHLTHTPF
jgi:hypothetical protein